MRFFAVKRQRLDGAVGAQHDGAAGSLVAPARLHADVAVLDDVEPADAVIAAQLVELFEHFVGLQRLAVDGDDVTLIEGELDVGGCVWCGFGRHTPAPHVFLGLGPGVFEHAAFVGDVQQVGIHRVGRLFLALGKVDRNVVLFAVSHELLAGVEVPLTPGRDHFDAWLERIGAQLEAYLVIALAGSAV